MAVRVMSLCLSTCPCVFQTQDTNIGNTSVKDTLNTVQTVAMENDFKNALKRL